jgi:Ca2+-binding RTX toxin-like protein
MGWVYKNLPPFQLHQGDHLAFDLEAPNDVNIQLKIELAPTAINGGDAPDGAFTTIASNSQLPATGRGNSTRSDFELVFEVEQSLNFAGGGLIIRFSSPGGAFASDGTAVPPLPLHGASGTDPTGFFLKRFYNDADGLPPYTGQDTAQIGGFRVTAFRKCRGRDPTIVGSDLADRLTGTRGADVIAGGGGDDRISGLGGKDQLCGGDGNDKLAGGADADKLEGEAGNDTLKGGKGKDWLKGGKGRDRLRGGKGTDVVNGGVGKDNERQ